MSDIDSELQWFIDKFSPIYSTPESDEDNGFIVASEFRRVSSSSDKAKFNIQKFRELMKLAVPDFATDNGEIPNSSKYAIRFNSFPVKVRLFDKELLTDKLFFDNLATVTLPGENLCSGEFKTDFGDWRIRNIWWSCVHKALIMYESTGEFKTDFLPKEIDTQSFTLLVNRWIYAYEILKNGWNDIQFKDPLNHKSYNDCFRSILLCFREIYWESRHENSLVNRPTTQRKHLSSIKNNGVNRTDVDGLWKGMNRERCDVAGCYAALNWLIKATKQSQNHEVKQALGKLEALLKTQSDEVYTLINRLSDPKRQEKYERKHNT